MNFDFVENLSDEQINELYGDIVDDMDNNMLADYIQGPGYNCYCRKNSPITNCPYYYNATRNLFTTTCFGITGQWRVDSTCYTVCLAVGTTCNGYSPYSVRC